MGQSSPQSDASNGHSKGTGSKVPKLNHLTAAEEEESLMLTHLREKYFCAVCNVPCIMSADGKHNPLSLYSQQIWVREIVSVHDFF
ncbi:MAG TPA: hypothetical protein VN457_05665 [Chlamydiales bacterium]|nr:hypothetical protein [Chlamydiales bacterium]